MTIEKKIENSTVTLELTGRLDTTTAPQLEGFLNENTADIADIVLDLAKLEYIPIALRNINQYVNNSTTKPGAFQGCLKLKPACDKMR